MSSFGWYPSSMTLFSLSGLSSSPLVDRRPKFITTFHFLPWTIWSMIALIISAAECPVALCALPTAGLHRLPPAIHSPLKLYLLISLTGAVTLFWRLMPGGKAKSDLPVALSAVSHYGPIWFVLYSAATTPPKAMLVPFNNKMSTLWQLLWIEREMKDVSLRQL